MKDLTKCKKWCTSIETDPETGQKFFRLPVDSYEMLGNFQNALTSVLCDLSFRIHEHSKHNPVHDKIMLLSELLHMMQLSGTEFEVLDEIAK